MARHDEAETNPRTKSTDRAPDRDRGSRSVAHDARLVVATLILAAIVAFSIANRRSTKVSWIVGDGTAPLAVVLAIAAVAGAMVGGLYLHRAQRHRS
jgi:uncharacterized integral membrane protein